MFARRVAFLVALVLATSGVASAAYVTPTVIPGGANTDKTCAAVYGGDIQELKVEFPAGSGTYSAGGLSVTLAVPSTQAGSTNSIDWTSNKPVEGVIVKDGVDGANWYNYQPAGSTGDTYLTTPNGGDKGISHVSFCYFPRLSVSKTAATTYTRTWQWDIDKSVTPAAWSLFRGDSGTSEYTISVDRTGYVDSAWAVSGTITIENDTLYAATVTGVTDVVSPAVGATVDCGVTFPHPLAVGGSLVCTYAAALPDGTSRVNTATVTTSGMVHGGSGTAAVTFGDPTTVVNDTIHVTDSYGPAPNDPWEFSNDGSVTYTRTFACDADEGTHDNTATITETGQHDDASVDVDCYALDVTKNAATEFTRTWTWTIDKSADHDYLLNPVILSPGQVHEVYYEVTVDATSLDSDFGVDGAIAIYNPAPMAATINSVADVVSPAIVGTVDCGVTFPYSLAAGGTLNCTYDADLPDDTTRTNTATATLQNYGYDHDLNATPGGTTAFSGTAEVDFSTAAMTEIDECIDVYDTDMGYLGTVCADDELPYTFYYSLTYGEGGEVPWGECGFNEHLNTASFETNDTETTGHAHWLVTGSLACEYGCTLTPGYWKTHSSFGPAPYDDTWALLGENTPFFFSGKTYYQVLWTSPSGGNAYYILAHAYIAAKLNMLNGASFGSAQAAFDQATTLFSNPLYTPAYVAGLRGKIGTALRAQFISLAGILDSYNNGYIGPGHCTE